MKTKYLIIGFVVLVLLLVMQVTLLNAQSCSNCKAKAATVENDEAVPNQISCPVMGGKINKEIFVNHNGERVYLCCAGCVEAFKKDPAKYLEKMEADGVVLEKAPITQVNCPVSGKPINEAIYTDQDGKRVYFCCDDCKKSFEKEPAKYM